MRRTVVISLAGAAVVLDVLLFAFAYLLQQRSGGDLNLSLRGQRLVLGASLALPLLPVAFAVPVTVAWLREPRGETRAPLTASLIALVVLAVLGGGGAFALGTVLDSHFPFSDTYLSTTPSPDGAEEALLFHESFCGFGIYVGSRDALVVRRVDHLSADCDDAPPRLVWTGEKPELLGPDGKRPADKPMNLFGGWH